MNDFSFVSLTTEVTINDIEENREELVEMLPKVPDNKQEATETCGDIVTSNVRSAFGNNPDNNENSQCSCQSSVVISRQNPSCEKDVQLLNKTEDVPKMKTKRGCWEFLKDMELYKIMTYVVFYSFVCENTLVFEQ